MMVGMGIPIAIAAAGAVKAFNDIERQASLFKRVYGDATTSVAEKSQMLSKMQATVGKEMMKYGVSMSDTLEGFSAQAAATGAKGADLICSHEKQCASPRWVTWITTRLLAQRLLCRQRSTLMLWIWLALQTSGTLLRTRLFLLWKIWLTLYLALFPVIKGLGGNVQDLAIMMTALRQGGVTAEQGANAPRAVWDRC